MAFTKAKAGEIRAEMEQALQAICDKHNMDFSIGNMSFTESKLSAPKLHFRAKGVASEQDLMYSAQCGFKGNAYGATFVHEGETFTIKGLKPRNKRQVIADGDKGNKFVFPKEMVFQANPSLKA